MNKNRVKDFVGDVLYYIAFPFLLIATLIIFLSLPKDFWNQYDEHNNDL